MTLGCVIMALDAFGNLGAYVAVGGLIWFAISYLMRPLIGPFDDDEE